MKNLADFETLNAAEEKLLNACMSGVVAVINEARPTEAISEGDKANTVRAALIRWLALGGDTEHPLHACGVQLEGAWIIDKLDLQGAELNANLLLSCCHVAEKLNIRGLKLKGSLNLHGSFLKEGLFADSMKIEGDVSFREGFESADEIRLGGASIGGTLSFAGAKLHSQVGGSALKADRVRVVGCVNLCNEFESIGKISFGGANIGGNLDCDKAKFQVNIGTVALNTSGAQISGSMLLGNNFQCIGSVCLIGASIKRGLVLMGLKMPLDGFDVSNCKVGYLKSHIDAWGKDLNLDGFMYGSLRGDNWQTKDFLAWLGKQQTDHYGAKEAPHLFKPQPWQQMIRVLRNMGHHDQASEIGIAFEKQRYAIGKVEIWAKPLHWLFGCLAAYGYKPLRLVGWMFTIWLSFGLCYWGAAYQGVFTPSDPLMFQHADYDTCRIVDTKGNPRKIENEVADKNTHNWYTCGALKGEYTTFSPLAYSLDVILPLGGFRPRKNLGSVY